MEPLVWYQIPGLRDHLEAAVIYLIFAIGAMVVFYRAYEHDSESVLWRNTKVIGNACLAAGVILSLWITWSTKSDFQNMQAFVEEAAPISQELEAYSHESGDLIFQSKLLRTAAKIAEVKGVASQDVKIALYQKLHEEIEKLDTDGTIILQDVGEFLQIRQSVKDCFTQERYLATVKYPADWDMVRQDLIDAYANQGYMKQVNINCEFLSNKAEAND